MGLERGREDSTFPVLAPQPSQRALLGRWDCRKTEFYDRGFPVMEDIILTGEERTVSWVL